MGLVERGEFIKTTKRGLAVYEYFKKADELLTPENSNNLYYQGRETIFLPVFFRQLADLFCRNFR